MASHIHPSIVSRPVYGRLKPVVAPAHLLVADADGGDALVELARSALAGFLQCAHICYLPSLIDRSREIELLDAAGLYINSTMEATQSQFADCLASMHMGTQIYLAGSESLIGLCMKTAMEAGIDHSAIQTEHRGTLARRVQCAHCKGITEHVTTQPASCAHCGLLLHVRDHYSRRIAAFQGVNINAEDPADVDPGEELFK